MRDDAWTWSRLVVLATAATLSVAAAACTQLGPYRTASIEVTQSKVVALHEVECLAGWGPEDRPAGDKAALLPCEPGGAQGEPSEGSKAIGRSSIQRRHYLYRGKGDQVPTQRGDYDLAFVEFDDQGWFARRPQMEALFMLLHRIEKESKTPENGHALIFVYVHGWKHNASQCDDNVICFSRLLERMDILERELRDKDAPRRRIVGVYVGWRGLSLDAGALSNVTFWTRKAAAERVGRGGVMELFTRLNEYRRARNPCRVEDKTQLVVAGHSFGGLVVYSALAHPLMERASRTDASRCGAESMAAPAPSAAAYETATSFGDLVVLVNPAFQGSLYEPLFHITTNRCYGAEQRPVMLTVTSSGDGATGTLFPLGRWFNARFQDATSNAQHDSIRKAVGHDGRYQTHELNWTGTATEAKREPAPEERDCGCRHLEPTSAFKWWSFVARIDAPPATPLQARVESDRRVYTAYGDNVSLVGDMKYSANYPYLVVRADAKIIEDHNAIYSEPFIRFLHSFFLVHIANRQPFETTGCMRDVDACVPNGLIPCEESCRLPAGGSCSGRSTEDLRKAR